MNPQIQKDRRGFETTVIGCEKSMRRMRERPGAVELWAVARMVAFSWAFFMLMPGMAIGQSAAPKAGGTTIRGRVFDAAQHAVEGATVRLHASGPPDQEEIKANSLETQTDASGAFVFAVHHAGSYGLGAVKAGVGSVVEFIEISDTDVLKKIDVTLSNAGHVDSTDGLSAEEKINASSMEFSDKPNFTVAGITDWTAVGGHGSDSILRTSETLARDTQGLRPETNRGAGLLSADEAAELSSIRADVAKGNLTEARLHVKAMLAKQPSSELYGVAGEIDEKLGDSLTAVRELEQAARLDPSEQNYFAWGSELLLHRAVWQAQEVFERGLKGYPKSARMETALGAALFAEARYEEAAQRLCAASDLDPRSAEPYLFMGRIGMVTPVSVPCLEDKLARFVREQPENSEANYLYAMTILKRQEQAPDAAAQAHVESLLTNAVKHDSKCADGYLQLGILESSRRSFDKAIDFYTRAIEANPQLADAHYRLGVAYDRTGKRDKAEAEFRVRDELVKQQSEAVEAQRREVKQFLVVLNGQPASPSTH